MAWSYPFVKTGEPLAVILTKEISHRDLHTILRKLGMGKTYAPAWQGVLEYKVRILFKV